MNEKALTKLMKAAYKGGGVKVFRSPEDVLYLAGPDGMPWGRWYDPETGTVVFLETVDRVRSDLTDKLGEIDFRERRGNGNGETQ